MSTNSQFPKFFLRMVYTLGKPPEPPLPSSKTFLFRGDTPRTPLAVLQNIFISGGHPPNPPCRPPKHIPHVTKKSVTSAPSFGRLLRFHHVGMAKCHVIGCSQLQQERKYFDHKIYSKKKDRSSNYTYRFSESFYHIWFTG